MGIPVWKPFKSNGNKHRAIFFKFWPAGALLDPTVQAEKGGVVSVVHSGSTGLYTVTLSDDWRNSDGYDSGLVGVFPQLTTAVAGSNSAECKGSSNSAKTFTIATYDGDTLTDFAYDDDTFVSCLIVFEEYTAGG